MSLPIEYQVNTASTDEIFEHLKCCDADFVPPLNARVNIKEYAKKIENKAVRFEAWLAGVLVGLVAVYCNDQENKTAYITSASVLKLWTGNGIAAHLMRQCIEYTTLSGMRQINLEVSADSTTAIRLYEKNGFIKDKVDALFINMSLQLKE